MYFSDLSHYTYFTDHALTDVLNVGWLDRSMPYTAGAAPEWFIARLKSWFWVARVNQMRGVHECNFCHAEPRWPLMPLKDNPSITADGRWSLLGNWEIWIPGPARIIFASPALIIHYIEVHHYLPPENFIAAVLDVEAMNGWEAMAELCKRL